MAFINALDRQWMSGKKEVIVTPETKKYLVFCQFMSFMSFTLRKMEKRNNKSLKSG